MVAIIMHLYVKEIDIKSIKFTIWQMIIYIILNAWLSVYAFTEPLISTML
jgi:hypothetical protein